MERKKEDRSFWMYFGLTIITCGIYGLLFFWDFCKDLNVVCRAKEDSDTDNSPNYLVVILLTIVTCGIYYFFWLYKQGNRMKRAGDAYGVRIEENGTSLLLWDLLGSLVFGIGSLVCTHMLIKNMNTLCVAYNKEFIDRVPTGRGNPYQNDHYGNGSSWQQNPTPDQPPYRQPGYNKIPTYDDQNTYSSNTTVGITSGTLICTLGQLNGARIPLQNHEIVTIGRDGNVCNLVLPDMDISRKHCTVQFMDNQYVVTDYSSSGVKLNGCQQLEKNVMVTCPRGSRILLGNGSNEFLLQ
jgi:hypothetical protein